MARTLTLRCPKCGEKLIAMYAERSPHGRSKNRAEAMADAFAAKHRWESCNAEVSRVDAAADEALTGVEVTQIIIDELEGQ